MSGHERVESAREYSDEREIEGIVALWCDVSEARGRKVLEGQKQGAGRRSSRAEAYDSMRAQAYLSVSVPRSSEARSWSR